MRSVHQEDSDLFLVEDLGLVGKTKLSVHFLLVVLSLNLLGADVISQVQHVIRDSLLYGLANPAAPLSTMRAYAQNWTTRC